MAKNEYVIEGLIVKIKLTQGQWAIIDEKNFELVKQYKWHSAWNPDTKTCYVTTTVRNQNTGKRTTLRMHRLIMGATDPKMHVDHWDHNTLNNLESNLRLATNSQNHMNRIKRNNTSSKYKGVHLHKTNKKWLARIIIDGERKNLGYFLSEVEAARAYNKAAIAHYKEFALLNVIA